MPFFSLPLATQGLASTSVTAEMFVVFALILDWTDPVAIAVEDQVSVQTDGS